MDMEEIPLPPDQQMRELNITNGHHEGEEEEEELEGGVINSEEEEEEEISSSSSTPPLTPPPPPKEGGGGEDHVVPSSSGPVWNWSCDFKERQIQILKFGFLSDFTIFLKVNEGKVGANPVVNVHKVVLAASCPYFYNEVLRVVGEGGNTLEVQEDPQVFMMFLNYLYTGEVSVPFKEAFMLQRLGRKYDIPDLVKKCDGLIAKTMFTLDNAFVLLPIAVNSSYGHEALAEALISFACKNGKSFLEDPRFLNLPSKAVVELFKRDDLAVGNELDIFRAMMAWAQHQCRVLKKDENLPGNFGPFITDLVPHVRFPFPTEFSPKFWIAPTTALAQETLKKDISGRLLEKMLENANCVFPPYNTKCRKYAQPVLLFHSRYSDKNKKKRGSLTAWRSKNPRTRFREALLFQVNLPFVIYGFSVVRGAFGENFDKSIYDYSDLEVQVGIGHSADKDNGEEIEIQLIPVEITKCNSSNKVKVTFKETVELEAYVWTCLYIAFFGSIKYKSKNAAKGVEEGYQELPVAKCHSFVGTGMSTSHKPSLIQMDQKIVLPLSCECKRPQKYAEEEGALPIDKGYIEVLVFSLHHRPPTMAKENKK